MIERVVADMEQGVKNDDGQSVPSPAACEDSQGSAPPQQSAVTMTSLSAAEGGATAVSAGMASVGCDDGQRGGGSDSSSDSPVVGAKNVWQVRKRRR